MSAKRTPHAGRRAALIAGVVLAAAGAVVWWRVARPVQVAPVVRISDTHVHEIVADPTGPGILVGAHAGLFRIDAPGAEPVLVGDLYHDLMGLEALPDGTLIASGHPDLRTDLPVLLGFRVSEDGGRTWRAVALEGEADLHALVADGATMYGYDSSGGRFLRSTDAGASWSEGGTLPATADLALFDGRLFAATEEGVYASTDGGQTWTSQSAEALTSLAAYAGALYAATADGTLVVSGDDAAWTSVVGGAPGDVAVVRAVRDDLWVARHDTAIVRYDGGAWEVWFVGGQSSA